MLVQPGSCGLSCCHTSFLAPLLPPPSSPGVCRGPSHSVGPGVAWAGGAVCGHDLLDRGGARGHSAGTQGTARLLQEAAIPGLCTQSPCKTQEGERECKTHSNPFHSTFMESFQSALTLSVCTTTAATALLEQTLLQALLPFALLTLYVMRVRTYVHTYCVLPGPRSSVTLSSWSGGSWQSRRASR